MNIQFHFRRIVVLGIFVQLLALSGARGQDDFIVTSRSSTVVLEKPSEEASFSFAIFGDRTGGPDSGLLVLEKAVGEVNTIGPDMVMTVGDLIQGYNQREAWLRQMREYKAIMNRLAMPWFPVAGNHDTYWRGEGRPEDEHDGDYEQHFGPLWYAFAHKNCWFVVLYSDEGNAETGEKNFNKPECQEMSPQQMRWLERTLEQARGAAHVFVFLHHPRWHGGKYGDNWNQVHAILRKAGNVSAVFAGHVHTMRYVGPRDKISYYTLATTGGGYNERNPLMGKFHHYNLVTVRGDAFHVAAFPVGSAIDPESPKRTEILLQEQSWAIHQEQQRQLKYPIRIPEFKGSGVLKIGIKHGADNTGDKGLTYALLQADGAAAGSGFFNGGDYQWIQHPVVGKQELLLVLTDADTEMTGQSPGNGGQIVIELDVTLDNP